MLTTPSIILLVILILVVGVLFACAYFDVFALPSSAYHSSTTHTESFWSPPPPLTQPFLSTNNQYQHVTGASQSNTSDVGLALSSPSNCPTCEWKCDDAECPQDCRSECAPPQCTIKCKPLAPARCTVKCAPPRCRNVCPDDGKCMRGKCNLCQSVCDPPQCQVTCQPPKPECVTQCAPPNCKRVCVAPTNCPQPVCRMVCE